MFMQSNARVIVYPSTDLEIQRWLCAPPVCKFFLLFSGKNSQTAITRSSSISCDQYQSTKASVCLIYLLRSGFCAQPLWPPSTLTYFKHTSVMPWNSSPRSSFYYLDKSFRPFHCFITFHNLSQPGRSAWEWYFPREAQGLRDSNGIKWFVTQLSIVMSLRRRVHRLGSTVWMLLEGLMLRRNVLHEDAYSWSTVKIRVLIFFFFFFFLFHYPSI